MAYFHDLINRDKRKVIMNNPFSTIIKDYKQPEWCGKFEALNGIFGCNILLGLTHHSVNEELCSNCKEYKNE